jgi:hypothetical protein
MASCVHVFFEMIVNRSRLPARTLLQSICSRLFRKVGHENSAFVIHARSLGG